MVWLGTPNWPLVGASDLRQMEVGVRSFSFMKSQTSSSSLVSPLLAGSVNSQLSVCSFSSKTTSRAGFPDALEIDCLEVSGLMAREKGGKKCV